MGLWNICKKAAAGWTSGMAYVFSGFDKDTASDVCEELTEKWNIDGQAQLTKERKIKEEISEKDNTIKELLKEVKELRKEANQSKNKEQKKEKLEQIENKFQEVKDFSEEKAKQQKEELSEYNEKIEKEKVALAEQLKKARENGDQAQANKLLTQIAALNKQQQDNQKKLNQIETNKQKLDQQLKNYLQELDKTSLWSSLNWSSPTTWSFLSLGIIFIGLAYYLGRKLWQKLKGENN